MTKKWLRPLAAIAWLALAVSAHGATAEDPLDLAHLHGKVVYVDFWASWCVPCRQSFPWMASLQKQFAADGLVVLAVNVDHERRDADRFLSEFAPDFRIVYDTGGVLAERYHLKGMPTSFLIDRDGKVQSEHIGFRPADRDALTERIHTLLQTH